MSNKKINQTIKERCIELDESGSYQEARDEEFSEQFFDKMFPSGVNTNLEKWRINEDDVIDFMNEFEFKEEFEWIVDKAESEAEDYADQAYQEYKERDI